MISNVKRGQRSRSTSQEDDQFGADPADTADDWSKKHDRHRDVRSQCLELHDQMHAIATYLLARKVSSEHGLRLGGHRERLQARWSMGTWSQKGAIYLFAVCLKRKRSISVNAVVYRKHQQAFIKEGFSAGTRVKFTEQGAETLCAVVFRVNSLQEALPKFAILERFGYLDSPSGVSSPPSTHTSPPNSNGEDDQRRLTVRDEIPRSHPVVKAVLKKAEGKCALCKEKAYFNKADGSPFLQVHHIDNLAAHGKDSDVFNNCVALHADCHPEAHYASEARVNEIRKILKSFRAQNGE
ncbi:MAG: hypothetical protein C4K60_00240 [Ideonella sp. MAG2]|nr:MAG: hypothetical protein C4K60_00240 [Ideonella sp. MAG2]